MTRSPGRRLRRYRVPAQHGELLIEPPLSAVEELLRSNRRLLAGYNFSCLGRHFQSLSREARQRLVERAASYTSAYQAVEHPLSAIHSPATLPIVLAGHQPQLFHPGVWTKHFVLGKVARLAEAAPINLLIDNDTMRSSALRVPAGTVEEPRLENVPLDEPSADIPYEQREIRDFAIFRAFGQRVQQTVQDLVSQPLVDQLWPLTVEASQGERNLGRCVARARHQLEFRWGLRNLEVPLGEVCSEDPFFWFAGHLLVHLGQFWKIHNEALAEYRQLHALRSRSHPVPELATSGSWLEAPFWVWQQDQPRRRRLFVRQRGSSCELTDRRQLHITLEPGGPTDGEAIAAQLGQETQSGLRLRPRALITTMYARLFLSDIFLHGIGGATYDELTDVLIQRFFGVPAPGFMVVTGTFLLPLPRGAVRDDDLRQLDRQLRELRYHPERFLGTAADPEALRLAQQKRSWIDLQLPRGQRLDRHQAIERLNHQLQAYVAEQREALEARRPKLIQQLRRAALLGARDYSFCLYPEETLRPHLLEVFCREV